MDTSVMETLYTIKTDGYGNVYLVEGDTGRTLPVYNDFGECDPEILPGLVRDCLENFDYLYSLIGVNDFTPNA